MDATAEPLHNEVILITRTAHVLDGFVRNQWFSSFNVEEGRYRHTPAALAGDAPVTAALRHGADAALALNEMKHSTFGRAISCLHSWQREQLEPPTF